MANEIEFSFLEPSDLMKKTTYDPNTDNVVDVAKDIEGFDSASDDTFYGKIGGVTGFYSVPDGNLTVRTEDFGDVGTYSYSLFSNPENINARVRFKKGLPENPIYVAIDDDSVLNPSIGSVIEIAKSGEAPLIIQRNGSVVINVPEGFDINANIEKNNQILRLVKVGPSEWDLSLYSYNNTLGELLDVDTTGITTGQVIQYDGTSFVPATISGGSGATTLSELTDVDTTGVATNNVLKYNGSSWVDGAVAYSEITGTPTLSTVATSGSYNDLADQPSIPSGINDLTDVDTSGITSGQVLQYNGTSFVAATVSSGASSIDDLTDVNLTGISTGQILNWDGSQFVPVNMPDGGGTTPTQLGELTNVDTTGQATNDVLKFNGTNWVPDNVAYSEITGTPTLSTVATTGSYNDLSDQPSIPSTINQLTDVVTTGVAVNNVLKYDGSNWVDGSIAYSEVSGTPTLSTVATTGSYNDLTNLPVLSAVATSGSYTDLSNTPSIPSAINDLSDVDTTGITTGQVLQYNGTSFVAATISGGGASALDDLSDVDTSTTAPSTGDTLVYNGTEWVPQAPATGGGGTASYEYVELRYDSGASKFTNAGALVSTTSNVTATITDPDNCIVTFTFTGKSYPPTNIITYGQVGATNEFIMNSVNTSYSTRKVSAGLDVENPTLFNGTFDETITMELTKSATFASGDAGTGFGAPGTKVYVMFMFGA